MGKILNNLNEKFSSSGDLISESIKNIDLNSIGGTLEPLIVTATHTGDTTTDKGYYTLYHSEAVTYSHSYEEVMEAIAEGREVILKESTTTQTLCIKRYSSSAIFFERTQTNYLFTDNNPRAVIDTYFFSLLKSSSKQGKYTRISANLDGINKPFYPIVEFDDQMQVTKIEQGMISAKGGTIIGRMGGEEQPFSVITLSTFSQSGETNRYFVSVFRVGVFELILNASNEITETQFIHGRISVCALQMRTINSHEIGDMGVSHYPVLISVDDSTEEETTTQFTRAHGGKKLYSADSDIVPLNYGVTDNVLFYNKGLDNITFDANAEWYEITSI